MRIATWNINSVRLRINRVAAFAQANNPDIICLQETKVMDDLFPLEAVQEMGYPHVVRVVHTAPPVIGLTARICCADWPIWRTRRHP